MEVRVEKTRVFPYFFVGTFIEASLSTVYQLSLLDISLLFRRDFH